MLTCPTCTNPVNKDAEYCALCGVDLLGEDVDTTRQGMDALPQSNISETETVEGPAISECETAVDLDTSFASQVADSKTVIGDSPEPRVQASAPTQAMGSPLRDLASAPTEVVVEIKAKGKSSSSRRPPAGDSTQILLGKERARAFKPSFWMGFVALVVIAVGLFSVRDQIKEIAGNSSEADLSGTWFRIGDKAEGTAVVVSAVGEGYEARASLVAEHLQKFGFTENDLLWREISRLDTNHYRGKVLYKQTELPSGKVIRAFYKEHDFFLDAPNLLRTRSLASGDEVIGTEQVWKKMED